MGLNLFHSRMSPSPINTLKLPLGWCVRESGLLRALVSELGFMDKVWLILPLCLGILHYLKGWVYG